MGLNSVRRPVILWGPEDLKGHIRNRQDTASSAPYGARRAWLAVWGREAFRGPIRSLQDTASSAPCGAHRTARTVPYTARRAWPALWGPGGPQKTNQDLSEYSKLRGACAARRAWPSLWGPEDFRGLTRTLQDTACSAPHGARRA